jgi:hypothetical protein
MQPLALNRAIQHGIRDTSTLANIALHAISAAERTPDCTRQPGPADDRSLKFYRWLPDDSPRLPRHAAKAVPQVNTLLQPAAGSMPRNRNRIATAPDDRRPRRSAGAGAAHPSALSIRIWTSAAGEAILAAWQPPHGIDVDTGLMRNDGRTVGVNYKLQPSAHSLSLTRQMVNTIRGNGVLKVH